jgi:hypothetical protein
MRSAAHANCKEQTVSTIQSCVSRLVGMLDHLDVARAARWPSRLLLPCSEAGRGWCTSTSDFGLVSSRHLTEPSPCSGKTALAATIGLDSEFPFVKILSAETMVGLSEVSKSNMISKVSHAVCRDQGAKRRA